MKIFKRIILFLAIILSVLWIEAVHADMSGPELREFEIVVVNPNGVDYYDYQGNVSGHLNKDDTVLVLYEYNKKYTIGVEKQAEYGSTHHILGYISNLEGFSIVQEEVDPTKLTDDKTITKYDSAQKAKVYADDGVDILKGPSSVYDKVGHIKKGTEITFKYSIDTIGNATHIYVEYNGVKGWVEILEEKVLLENKNQYIFRTDLSTACGTIPKNSITTPAYTTDGWSHKALFEYNGCEFLHNVFRDDDIIYIHPVNKVLGVDVSLYEYGETTSSVLATIPTGTEITVLGSNDYPIAENNILYVEYNGVRGWIISDGEVIDYKTPVNNQDPDPEINNTIEVEEPETPAEEPTVKTGINPQELIVLCALGGSLLVITAIVIIILVNKNKKAKEAPVETKKEEK